MAQGQAVSTSPQFGGFNKRAVQSPGTEGLPRDGSVQRENAGAYGPGQSMFVFSARIPLTGSTQILPIHQPPVAPSTATNGFSIPPKNLYISDMYINTNDTTNQEEFKLQMVFGSVTVDCDFRIVKGDTCPVEEQQIETQIPVPAGATLQMLLPADNGKVAFVTVRGFQQDIGAF